MIELLLTKFISPGVKIELEAVERTLNTAGTPKKAYESKVVDVLDEERLEILMPMEQTKLVLLPVGGEYHIHFWTSKGMFQCDAKVSNRYKSGALYLLEVKLTSGLQKYQRREYYRYSCMLDMDIRVVTQQEKRLFEEKGIFEAEGDLPCEKATILDMSGGGMRFTSALPVESKELVLCDYTLSRENVSKRMILVGQVLSCRLLENNLGQYELRVQFVNIAEREREEIIRFIFEEERKKRQRDS